MLSFLQNLVLSSFTGIETPLSYLSGFPWFGMGEKKRGHKLYCIELLKLTIRASLKNCAMSTFHFIETDV